MGPVQRGESERRRLPAPLARIAALVVGLLLAAPAATAYDYYDDEGEADYGPASWYMGFNLGGGFETATQQIGDQELGSGRIGYRAQDNFASELQFEFSDLGDQWFVSFNAKVPLTTRRIQPFLGYGVGLASAFGTEDAAFRAGGGLDFFLTGSVALTVQGDYVRGLSDLEDLHYVSVTGGLRARF